MSLTTTFAAALMASASPEGKACTPDPPGAGSRAEAEAYIRRAETDWAASIAKSEAAYLRRVTADSFVAVLEGKVLTREAMIAEAEGRDAGAASDKLESVRVHVSDSIAIAEGVEVWTDNAPMRRMRIVWSDIWVRCAGAWRLMNSTSASTPAA